METLKSSAVVTCPTFSVGIKLFERCSRGAAQKPLSQFDDRRGGQKSLERHGQAPAERRQHTARGRCRSPIGSGHPSSVAVSSSDPAAVTDVASCLAQLADEPAVSTSSGTAGYRDLRHDMVLHWTADAKITSHGPSDIGFPDFGIVHRLKVWKRATVASRPRIIRWPNGLCVP
jgi:hypothetical protein